MPLGFLILPNARINLDHVSCVMYADGILQITMARPQGCVSKTAMSEQEAREFFARFDAMGLDERDEEDDP